MRLSYLRYCMFGACLASLLLRSGELRGAQVDGRYISVSAEGAASMASGMSEAERRKSAAENAYYAAIEKLAEYVAGVAISGGVRMENSMISGGRVIQLVKAELRGVEETSCEFTRMKDGSLLARSTIRIPAEEKERIAGLLTVRGMHESRNGAADAGQTSGIIIDLRAVAPEGWIPSYPVVRSRAGSIVFSPGHVHHEVLLRRLPAGFAATLAEAENDRERIGEYPVILRGMAIGTEGGGTIILADPDAAFINGLPNLSRLLERGGIIFVL